MQLRRMLRAGQVAARLGVSPTRVNQLRQSGQLQGELTVLGYLFSEKEVARLEAERRDRRKGKAALATK